MRDPLDVGNNCSPFPADEVLHSNFEIFHDRIDVNARKIASEFVIETKTIVADKGLLDRWYERRNIVSFCYLPAPRECDDIIGKSLQRYDHFCSPAWDLSPAARMTRAVALCRDALSQRRMPAEDFHRTNVATITTAPAKSLESAPRLSDSRTESFTPTNPPTMPPATKIAATCQSTSPARA